MKLKILTIILCSITYLSLGQSVQKSFIDFEKQYDGGEKAYFDWLSKNIKYPGEAKDNDRQGLVVIGFILTKEARIIDLKVKNSVGFGCDEEAIRLLKMIEGKLKPNSKDNEYFEMTLRFKLADTKELNRLIEEANKLYSKEKYKNALKILDEVIRQAPYNIDMLLKRAVARGKTGDMKGSCVDWTRIKELNKEAKDIYLDESCN
jgi:TonB family protein